MVKKVKKSCCNCEFKNLCGCPVVDYDIEGQITFCSSWSISFNAYVEEEEKKIKKA